jgi:hypothetical protein
MIELAILFGIFIAAIVWERQQWRKERLDIWRLAAEERRALEDRLIALTDRDASVLVSAQERFQPGDVTYVDERKEWELDSED